MIVSVSRRTDIPAFYSEWFFNRLKEGYVHVLNPINKKQISEISLSPKDVDCFVFWTKNPEPMIDRLDELKDYDYYFQFTITPYGKDVESGIVDKNKVVETFITLSQKIGKERVILRYDPILLTEKYNIEYHKKAFEKLCSRVADYTEKCVISFVDLYKKTERNTKSLNIIPMYDDTIKTIAKNISETAAKYNLQVETCSEGYDLSEFNIVKGKCIDDNLVSKITGYEIYVDKDKTQREVCGCVKSVDIGQYNTCRHHCLYCYANFNYEIVEENVKLHDDNKPMLVGEKRSGDKVTVRKMKSVKKNKLPEVYTEQGNLFDKL